MTAASELLSLADYERAARELVSPAALDYIDGGAADEITLADNTAAWGRLALRPRMLVGAGGDLTVSVLGVTRPHPVLVAPTAFQRLGHPDGEVGTARAAAATGTVMCVSTLASAGPATVAQAVPHGTRWFALYVLRDRGVTRELVHGAVEQGYEAVVVTVDRPVLGLRDYSGLIEPDLRWSDIAQLAADCPLPVLVKGILTAEDAELAIAHGVAG
ncbi:MAG TPA: alpha-hydroxy-acid oxidizing protein, partial [Thermomicrobiaceae bacterium]|nr:alpha-hydroxy-acid oxidizing protein [Thermomicrobiaceae bacterium]